VLAAPSPTPQAPSALDNGNDPLSPGARNIPTTPGDQLAAQQQAIQQVQTQTQQANNGAGLTAQQQQQVDGIMTDQVNQWAQILMNEGVPNPQQDPRWGPLMVLLHQQAVNQVTGSPGTTAAAAPQQAAA
jgi:hypothetical protein